MYEKRTYPFCTVIESCANCGSEITMEWNVEIRGYEAYCPVCGELIMLCNQCRYYGDEEDGDCDWNPELGLCKRNSIQLF